MMNWLPEFWQHNQGVKGFAGNVLNIRLAARLSRQLRVQDDGKFPVREMQTFKPDIICLSMLVSWLRVAKCCMRGDDSNLRASQTKLLSWKHAESELPSRSVWEVNRFGSKVANPGGS